jgi:polyhydroxybutyrate depolymerase
VLPILFLLTALLLGLESPALAQQPDMRTIVHQGIAREFLLHRPAANFTGPRPLMLVLHGSGQPQEEVRDWLPIDPVADREGFVVAYPRAVEGKWNYGAPAGPPVDDLGFLDVLVERLIAEKIADPARLYVAGISRGALMTYTLLCRRPGRFAAAAALSSGMTETQLADCPAPRLLPLLAIAGTADSVQRYDGWIDPPPSPRLLSIPETMEFWRRRYGCTGQTLYQGPYRQTERIDWTGCTTPLVLWRVIGGEHEPPAKVRGQEIDAAEEVWRFFAEQRAR